MMLIIVVCGARLVDALYAAVVFIAVDGIFFFEFYQALASKFQYLEEKSVQGSILTTHLFPL